VGVHCVEAGLGPFCGRVGGGRCKFAAGGVGVGLWGCAVGFGAGVGRGGHCVAGWGVRADPPHWVGVGCAGGGGACMWRVADCIVGWGGGFLLVRRVCVRWWEGAWGGGVRGLKGAQWGVGARCGHEGWSAGGGGWRGTGVGFPSGGFAGGRFLSSVTVLCLCRRVVVPPPVLPSGGEFRSFF